MMDSDSVQSGEPGDVQAAFRPSVYASAMHSSQESDVTDDAIESTTEVTNPLHLYLQHIQHASKVLDDVRAEVVKLAKPQGSIQKEHKQ